MYVLMIRWFIPPLILQLFVVMGFLITIYFSPLRGNVYVQPYKYGQIYKQIEDFNSSELTLRVSTKKDLPELLERKKDLLENAARYFKGQVILVGLLEVIESEPVNSRVETILACISRSTKDERKGIGERKGGS